MTALIIEIIKLALSLLEANSSGKLQQDAAIAQTLTAMGDYHPGDVSRRWQPFPGDRSHCYSDGCSVLVRQPLEKRLQWPATTFRSIVTPAAPHAYRP